MVSITSTLVKKTKWRSTGKRSRKAKSIDRATIFISLLYGFSSYKRNKVLTAVTWFLIIVTGGLLRLIFHWIPHLMLLATHSKCQLETADTVLLIEKFQGKHTSYYVKKLKTLAAQDIV